MENAAQDSEEDGKQVLYIKSFIARGNFKQNTRFMYRTDSARYSGRLR